MRGKDAQGATLCCKPLSTTPLLDADVAPADGATSAFLFPQQRRSRPICRSHLARMYVVLLSLETGPAVAASSAVRAVHQRGCVHLCLPWAARLCRFAPADFKATVTKSYEVQGASRMLDNTFRPAARVPWPRHFHRHLLYPRPNVSRECPRARLWLRGSPPPPLHVYPTLPPRLHARAAQARLPRRLFRPLPDMDQMPGRDNRTRGTVLSGQVCDSIPGGAARTSSLRVVPCALRAVKGMASTGSSRQLCRRHNRSDIARGGGR